MALFFDQFDCQRFPKIKEETRQLLVAFILYNKNHSEDFLRSGVKTIITAFEALLSYREMPANLRVLDFAWCEQQLQYWRGLAAERGNDVNTPNCPVFHLSL